MADKFSFLQKIYGSRSYHIVNREAMNSDEEFEKVLNNLFCEMAETYGALHFTTGEALLSDTPKADMVRYLTENAEEIADSLIAASLRFLRHPRSSNQLRPFFKYFHLLEEDEWFALEEDIMGRRLEDDECIPFATKLQAAFDSMEGDKINALLAVRFDSPIADKNDPEIIARYEAVMDELKKAVQQ